MNRAFIVLGLGFGDEGKGAVVDRLCREHDADRVVRFNGGAQASHTVVLPDGSHHSFHQFGSGTFAGASTHLSRYMMINPAAIFQENEQLIGLGVHDALGRLSVHEDALITTRFHVAANRLRETVRGDSRHGSCGLGIGETMHDYVNGNVVIFARDLLRPTLLREKLIQIRTMKYIEARGYSISIEPPDMWWEEYKTLSPKHAPHEIDHLIDLYRIFGECVEIRHDTPLDGVSIFEGAQGVLLDQDLPAVFQPHTTWSKTTSAHALDVIYENGAGSELTQIGVLRAYMTRHGAGPLPTYSERFTEHLRDDPHNPPNAWQGSLRVGHLDLALLRFAVAFNDRPLAPLDHLAVTCLDQVNEAAYVRDAPSGSTRVGNVRHKPRPEEYRRVDRDSLPAVIEEALGVPVGIRAYGPTYEDQREGVVVS